MFLGPNRSPSRPVTSSGTAYASRYALVTQTTLLMSVCRSFMIAGLATATMELSTRIMKKPMTRAHRAGHGFRCSGGDVGGAVRSVSIINPLLNRMGSGVSVSVVREVPASLGGTGERGSGLEFVDFAGEVIEPFPEQFHHGGGGDVVRLRQCERELRVLVHRGGEHVADPVDERFPARLGDLVHGAFGPVSRPVGTGGAHQPFAFEPAHGVI